MRNFRRLEIWKNGMSLAIDLYKVCDLLPSDERFGLRSQLTRAAVSVPSNIAEGSRGSIKEMKQYLRIALGSLNEIETQLILCEKLKMVPPEESRSIVRQTKILQAKIVAYIKYLHRQ